MRAMLGKATIRGGAAARAEAPPVQGESRALAVTGWAERLAAQDSPIRASRETSRGARSCGRSSWAAVGATRGVWIDPRVVTDLRCSSYDSCGIIVHMKLSTLLITLGGLLAVTTRKWPIITWDKRTIRQIYQDAKAGKLRSSLYAKIVAPLSLLLIIIGTYLELTWR